VIIIINMNIDSVTFGQAGMHESRVRIGPGGGILLNESSSSIKGGEHLD
jgi:hypothetical protein